MRGGGGLGGGGVYTGGSVPRILDGWESNTWSNCATATLSGQMA